MCCWVVSLTTTIILREGGGASLSTHEGDAAEICHPNHRCRALGARRGEVTRATTVLHLLLCEHLDKISVAQMLSYFRGDGKES